MNILLVTSIVILIIVILIIVSYFSVKCIERRKSENYNHAFANVWPSKYKKMAMKYVIYAFKY